MRGLYKDDGIVLRTIKLGEADRIVTMYTRQNGKVRAVAKGIRKTKSRFGGRLEPFTHVHLMVYRGRDLDTITSADILTSFKEVRDDYARVTAAAALAELVEKMTPDRERASSTYSLLLSGLRAIADGKVETIVPAFLVKLLSLSGYHPQLKRCAGCGDLRPLGAFSAPLGGGICESCWLDDQDAMRLTGDKIALLARLLAKDFGERAEPQTAAVLTDALRRYAEYHLERRLNSLHFLPAS